MEKTLEITRSLDVDELRKLANAEGPCITAYMMLQPAPNQSRFDFQRLRAAIRQADQTLRDEWPDLPASTTAELVDSLHMVESESDQWGGEGGSLVILRSPDVFRAFEVKQELDETVVVGDFFHVFPFLHTLQVAGQTFYILALSQKNVRLLRCTRTSSEQVPLPDQTPTNLEEFLNTRMPNASPSSKPPEHDGPLGSFNSTHDMDKKDEYLAHFYHAVNKGVSQVLKGETNPLVLCGVEYERAMYAGINNYEHLWTEGVQGSPESLKGGEMHARALELVQDYYAQPARKALAQWERIAGSDRAETSFPDLVKAAFEGRIGQLFVREGSQTMGVFDRNEMQMKVQGRQEDLVNAAALQTLAFGGEVFVMKPEDVPGGHQMAAILRY